LTGVIRDFQSSHPDFESALGVDPGIVETMLGADGKPVYAGMPDTPTTHGQQAFDQWYRDVPGTNDPLVFFITLIDTGDGDVYSYENNAFFPIDGQGFGDEGNAHNYHFTFELRTKFRYQGGESFKFTGDDDLFTFINGHLAIDLGGVHGAMTREVNLDDKAAEFGMQIGEIYPLDFFFAERHTTQSNFRIDTSLSFVDCGDTDPK
jgi:fibro-slime domain-containing protein